jgi:hypothetical protein
MRTLFISRLEFAAFEAPMDDRDIPKPGGARLAARAVERFA